MQKGTKDVVSDGIGYLECTEDGSPRRCGGQGDVLSGSIATFLAWSFSNRHQQQHQHQQQSPNKQSPETGKPSSESGKQSELSCTVVSCYAASLLLRTSAKEAFSVYHRGTTTPNIIDKIPQVFEQLWPSSQFMK